jgi:hypothetical protein
MTATTFTVLNKAAAGAVTGTFAGLPEGQGLTVNGNVYVVSYAGGDGNDVTLTRLPGGIVTGEQINDGSAQRSMVTSITLTFSSGLPAADIPAVLRGLSLIQLGQITPVGLKGALLSSTQLVVTFTGGWVSAGSLTDGRYTFSYAGSTLLNGTQLYRLYGDVNGDGKVDATDLAAFQKAYRSRTGMANYCWYFDVNGDGSIDATDYAQFLHRYGAHL